MLVRDVDLAVVVVNSPPIADTFADTNDGGMSATYDLSRRYLQAMATTHHRRYTAHH